MHSYQMKVQRVATAVLMLAVATACTDEPTAPESPARVNRNGVSANAAACASDNAGLTLPHDFCAVVFADIVVNGQPAAARHMAITPKGDVFVAINSPRNNQPAFGI